MRLQPASAAAVAPFPAGGQGLSGGSNSLTTWKPRQNAGFLNHGHGPHRREVADGDRIKAQARPRCPSASDSAAAADLSATPACRGLEQRVQRLLEPDRAWPAPSRPSRCWGSSQRPPSLTFPGEALLAQAGLINREPPVSTARGAPDAETAIQQPRPHSRTRSRSRLTCTRNFVNATE